MQTKMNKFIGLVLCITIMYASAEFDHIYIETNEMLSTPITTVYLRANTDNVRAAKVTSSCAAFLQGLLATDNWQLNAGEYEAKATVGESGSGDTLGFGAGGTGYKYGTDTCLFVLSEFEEGACGATLDKNLFDLLQSDDNALTLTSSNPTDNIDVYTVESNGAKTGTIDAAAHSCVRSNNGTHWCPGNDIVAGPGDDECGVLDAGFMLSKTQCTDKDNQWCCGAVGEKCAPAPLNPTTKSPTAEATAPPTPGCAMTNFEGETPDCKRASVSGNLVGCKPGDLKACADKDPDGLQDKCSCGECTTVDPPYEKGDPCKVDGDCGPDNGVCNTAKCIDKMAV